MKIINMIIQGIKRLVDRIRNKWQLCYRHLHFKLMILSFCWHLINLRSATPRCDINSTRIWEKSVEILSHSFSKGVHIHLKILVPSYCVLIDHSTTSYKYCTKSMTGRRCDHHEPEINRTLLRSILEKFSPVTRQYFLLE